MITLRRLLLALCLGAALPANAAPSAPFTPAGTYASTQWAPLDLTFTAQAVSGNPVDLDFSATFTGPAGESKKVHAFYNGSNHYVIRFPSSATGRWSFVTTSTQSALNQLTGTVTVTAATQGQHGPVKIHPDKPRQFAYADGSVYFPIAFEADWVFALDAENPAGIPKTKTLINHVAENGFNQLILNVFAYDVTWPRDAKLDPQYDYGKPRVFPFGGHNATPEHETINVEFFQRFDRVIEELDRRGIAAHIMIYVWNKQVSWPASRSAADNRYFDYVVKRYQGYPNIIWDISKEATGYGHNDVHYITDRIERLKALDAQMHLITVHDFGYCSKFPEKVDFISIQNWRSELWHVMMEARAKHPKKPILNIEHGGYERGPYLVFNGSYLSPDANLERAYQCVFAGTYPTHYWQDMAWNVIIHDPAVLPVAEQPKFHYYRHLANFVKKYDPANLTVDPDRSSSGFCLSNQKDLFVFLVPKENTSIVVRPPKGVEGTLHATWFDPFTGKFIAEPSRPTEQWVFYDHPQTGQMLILDVRLEPKQ